MLPLELDGSGRPALPDRRRSTLCTQSALHEHLDRYPDDFSGGQQQRIAIARSIVGQRRLLLADEPTGSLDTLNSDQIVEMLADLPSRQRHRGGARHPRAALRLVRRSCDLPPRRCHRRPDPPPAARHRRSRESSAREHDRRRAARVALRLPPGPAGGTTPSGTHAARHDSRRPARPGDDDRQRDGPHRWHRHAAASVEGRYRSRTAAGGWQHRRLERRASRGFDSIHDADGHAADRDVEWRRDRRGVPGRRRRRCSGRARLSRHGWARPGHRRGLAVAPTRRPARPGCRRRSRAPAPSGNVDGVGNRPRRRVRSPRRHRRRVPAGSVPSSDGDAVDSNRPSRESVRSRDRRGGVCRSGAGEWRRQRHVAQLAEHVDRRRRRAGVGMGGGSHRSRRHWASSSPLRSPPAPAASSSPSDCCLPTARHSSSLDASWRCKGSGRGSSARSSA